MNAAQLKFRSLSIKDLLEVRDAYHVHLTHLENVVATAIGLYRWAVDEKTGQPDRRPLGARGRVKPKTLANTVISEDSWPCVLVFVKDWIPPSQFQHKYDDIVPPRLYLKDGRVVPTCVLKAETAPRSGFAPPSLSFPPGPVGAGFPLVADIQGQQRVATVGCLVTDGHMTYALTNRHVVGEQGTQLDTVVEGHRRPVGTSDKRQVTKLEFNEAYPGWEGTRTYVNLDAGLVRLDDASEWSAKVYGIGNFDELVNLDVDTMTLDLIGCPVVAYGSASKLLQGEIQAFFYRYRAVGGFDYVADFLIGSRPGSKAHLATPGDSGAVWFLEQPAAKADKGKVTEWRRRPIALHWGGQTFIEGDGETETQYALATSLSTVCRVLDVELLREAGDKLPETWGKLGHYKIGNAACQLVSRVFGTKPLGKLMKANLDRISYSDDDLGDLKTALGRTQFVALSDVPDLVWKGTEAKRGRESPNHFADMDEPLEHGKTLLQLCEDDANVTVEAWNDFYEQLGVQKNHRGLLPFRIWQLFDVMVEYLTQRDLTGFFCAAGVLSHYVGDACQPLHVSRLHDGDPDVPEQKGVHSAYETKMIDAFAAEIIAGVNEELERAKAGDIVAVTSGQEAAIAAVALMRRSIEKLPPATIIEAFVKGKGHNRIKSMWNALGDATIDRIADGSKVLAGIWLGAWKKGKGDSLPAAELKALSKQALRSLYTNSDFAPSVYLTMMETRSGSLVIKSRG